MEPSPAHSRTIVVTNVSLDASEKKLTDFFTFCGRVESISLKTVSGEESSTAVIVFATEDAAQTSLLLTNAHVVDRAIKVSLLSELDPALITSLNIDSAAPVTSGDQIQQKSFAVPDEERSKTSVIASLLAAGYVLGEDVFKKAKDYDDRHMISLHVKVGAQVIKDKAHQIDQEYKISERVEDLKNAAVQQMQKIDERLQLSDTAASVAQTVGQTVSGIAQKALQNENISKGVSKISALTDTIKDSIEREKAEIQKAIREKQRTSPDAVSSTTTPNVADPNAPQAAAVQDEPQQSSPQQSTDSQQ